MGPLYRAVAAAAAAFAAVSLGACGGDEAEKPIPRVSSARVAMTVSYPGMAPFALITYRDRHGRACHGLGTLTANGPRVMGASGYSLSEGLTRRGKCLKAADRDVSLQVSKFAQGTPRVVGGIVRQGVHRVVVAGQSVRPRAGGEFLVVQPPDAGSLGEEVELEYSAGHHRRLPLKLVSS